MSKKPISITKNKIIGNLELNLMPKNKVSRVSVTYEKLTKGSNILSSSRDLDLYNNTYNFDSPYYKYRTLYPNNYLYDGDSFTEESIPALYSFDYVVGDGSFDLSHFTTVKTFNIEFDINSFSFPFSTTLSDSFYLKVLYNYYANKKVITYNKYYPYGSSKDINDENEILYFNNNNLVGENNQSDYSSWYELKASEFPQDEGSFSYDSGIFVKIISISKTSSSRFSIRVSFGTNYLKDSVSLIEIENPEYPDGLFSISNRTLIETFLKEVTIELWGQGYNTDGEDVYGYGTTLFSGDMLDINNSFINNKTTINSNSFITFVAGKLYENYRKGRKYGRFTTFYTDFDYIDDTQAYSGEEGNLIKVGDLLVFTDFLPDRTFFVTSVEFNANSGLLEIGFIERFIQYNVICSETTIISDSLII